MMTRTRTRVCNVEAAFEFDKDVAADASYQPREDAEAKVEGDAVLDLEENEQECIAAFTTVAERVVKRFAVTVRDHFPRVIETIGHIKTREQEVALAMNLPVRTASDRRKVVYVAHSFLDEYLVNSHRQLGNVSPSNFYLSDFVHVHENLYIGDAGGAFHAGPAGFTLVINCAAAEVPNYYVAVPSQNVDYVSLALPGGPMGMSAMVQQDWEHMHATVTLHKEHGKILVRCIEGRHRSAGIVYDMLQTCYNLNQQAAFDSLFRVVPHMDFHNVPEHLFEPSFDATFAESLRNISFDSSMERLRIRYEADGVLPVTALTPFYTFTSGGIKCSMVDYLVQFGMKRFGFASVSGFPASRVARALADVPGPIHLVSYPSHSPGTESKLAPFIRAMCREDGNRFVDMTNVLVRTRVSPQRSRGGDRSIGMQLDTIECRLPPDAANATFVCLDDFLNTGASFYVFALLMTRAGANGDNLHGVVLGRFSAQGPSHETQSDFVILSTSIASDVSVAAPPEVCIDVPSNFEPSLATLGCAVVRRSANDKTLAFTRAADALSAARLWLSLGLRCCPHFPIEDLGYPIQIVTKAPNVARLLRIDGKSLFVLSKVDNTQGVARKTTIQMAHMEWKTLVEEEWAVWDANSAAPVSTQEVQAMLQATYPPAANGEMGWEVLDHGGGNLARFANEKACTAALGEKAFGHGGFRLEWAFGAVQSRLWLSSSLSHEEAVQRIQTLSDLHVICTLSGLSLTSKVLSKHDGGVLNVICEKIRVECSPIKWGCDTTWSSTMQFCNELFFGTRELECSQGGIFPEAAMAALF